MTNKKLNYPAIAKEMAILTGAVAIIAAAVYFFLVPSHTSVSSISGLGIVLSNFVPLPLSAITMVLNIVLLIIGFFTCGREFGAKTVYTSVMLPVFLGLFERLFPDFGSMTDSQELDVLCYILVVSVGLSILFNRNASSGGLDIVAKIMNTACSCFYAVFSLVFSKEFFIFSFIVSIFFFQSFCFDSFHSCTSIFLSCFHSHYTAFFQSTCDETCQEVFFADGFSRVSAKQFLVDTFHHLVADLLADLQTCHVSDVFFASLVCTFIQTFDEVCHISSINVQTTCQIAFQTLSLSHTDRIRQ